jgi:hypothetical protein
MLFMKNPMKQKQKTQDVQNEEIKIPSASGISKISVKIVQVLKKYLYGGNRGCKTCSCRL